MYISSELASNMHANVSSGTSISIQDSPDDHSSSTREASLTEFDLDGDGKRSLRPNWPGDQQSDLLPSLAERLDKRQSILRVGYSQCLAFRDL